MKMTVIFIISVFINLNVVITITRAQPPVDEKYSIFLESREFVPEQESIAELNAKLESLRGRHVLIQFGYIPSDDEKVSLENGGIKLVDYIPTYAWYAKLTASRIEPSLGIRYITAIETTDKISPHLMKKGIVPRGIIDQNTAKVYVVFFNDVTEQEIESLIAKYGSGENVLIDTWEVTLNPDQLLEFASHDIVQWIENVPPEKIAHLNIVRSRVHANEVQTDPYNLHGNGYVAAMWDAGAAYSHTDYASRLTIGDGSGSHWHATLIAGAMAGNGARSQACGGSPYQWRGIATEAGIISYNWDYPTSEHSSAINTYGADVSQNSWGWDNCTPSYCYRFGDYDSYSRSYDMIARGLYGDKITIVGSTGNDGTCYICSGDLPNFPYGTVSGPIATSKNALSVSGTHANTDGWWTESSRGPTDDGRIKPDLCSPACKTYDGIKSTWTNNCYNSEYCGTSFSSPVVSGAAILIYEEYNNFYGEDPLPSTVRGLLYHSAHDLGYTGPDYMYGYGRINVQDAIDIIIEDDGQNFRIIEDQISNYQTDTYQMLVEASQLKVTLVWDDKEATAGSGVKLRNNLDLLLISPSQTDHYPWVLNWNSPSSPAITGVDTRNNMEQVVVNSPESGVWTVQVKGTTVPYGPQLYSLIGNFGTYTGSISGVVTDAETSSPVNGVYVLALTTSTHDNTDINGEYLLFGLEQGIYDVFFSHSDYYDTTIYGVTVNSNETTTLDVMLQPLAGADAGVSAILSPPDSIQFGFIYPLESEITNYGLNSQTFNVIFEVHVSGSPNIEIADTVMITNMPGISIDTVTFSDNLTPAFGTNYDLISYTALIGDQNNNNDTTTTTSYNYGGMKVWYGDPSGSPIFGFVNQRVGVDVYVQTSENTHVADMHLCLGSDDQYFDSLLSDTEGVLYYPLTEWDDAGFLLPQGSPPNPSGWSSQSFLGWADLFGEPNPWLHFETPTRILRFVLKTVDDTLLISDTVQCFGPGINSILGTSYATDSLGITDYPLFEQFSPLFFIEAGDCYYVPGDINGDGSTMGNDVTYGVRYFKGIGPSPPDSCWNEMSGSWLYSAGDANGNCQFTGSDITYLVAYFKGIQPSILWCMWTPPAGPLLLENSGDLSPLITPEDTDKDTQQ